MEWNFKSGLPIYSQIIDAMTNRIASHAYEPGEKLPSVRELAMDAGVNPNTMQRAMAELERRGLVYSERTSGRYVTDDASVLKALHEELAEKYFIEFVDRLRSLGISDEEIRTASAKWLNRIGEY